MGKRYVTDKIKFDDKIHVELIQSLASDMMVVHAARISTAAVKEKTEPHTGESGNLSGADKGLIKFLLNNRHGTPFEHGTFTFRVQVPIFVMRELHRHRIGFSYNEESGRYKELAPHFYIPPRYRPLTQVGKPGHYEYHEGSDKQIKLTEIALKESCELAWTNYKVMLESGIAKEVSRMLLPVNTYSSCYVTCNPRSLMSFLSLRTKDDRAMFPSFPMHEIEQMADQMEEYFADLMPDTHEAYCFAGRVAP